MSSHRQVQIALGVFRTSGAFNYLFLNNQLLDDALRAASLVPDAPAIGGYYDVLGGFITMPGVYPRVPGRARRGKPS